MTEPSVAVEIIVDDSGRPPVEPESLADIVAYAVLAAGGEGGWTITVVLTDDARLRQLHREFMGIDAETDVMTFPYDDTRGGDIVISIERAADQAPDFGHDTGEEVAFLAVHGVLHLCGWVDESPPQRQAMLDRQAKIIEAFRATRQVNTNAERES
jgi:probable rRNA maturation factor